MSALRHCEHSEEQYRVVHPGHAVSNEPHGVVYVADISCDSCRKLAGYSAMQARREPQRGPGKHSRGATKHFTGPLWGENF